MAKLQHCMFMHELYINQTNDHILRHEQRPPVEIPTDFFPSSANMDMHKKPFKDRYRIWDKLDRRPDAERTDASVMDEQTFALMLQNLYGVVSLVAGVYINDYLDEQLREVYPALTIAGGRRVKSYSDLEYFVAEYEGEMPIFREIMHFAMDRMWGRCSSWAVRCEADIMKMLGFCLGTTRMDGSLNKNVCTAGGTCKTVLIRRRSQMHDSLKLKLRKRFLESPCIRYSVLEQRVVPKDNKGPRIVEILKAEKAIHGFDGKLALCEGHPLTTAVAVQRFQENANQRKKDLKRAKKGERKQAPKRKASGSGEDNNKATAVQRKKKKTDDTDELLTTALSSMSSQEKKRLCATLKLTANEDGSSPEDDDDDDSVRTVRLLHELRIYIARPCCVANNTYT